MFMQFFLSFFLFPASLINPFSRSHDVYQAAVLVVNGDAKAAVESENAKERR